jgi:hypothetical protein
MELQSLEHTKPSRLAHRAEPKHEWEAEPEGEDVWRCWSLSNRLSITALGRRSIELTTFEIIEEVSAPGLMGVYEQGRGW